MRFLDRWLSRFSSRHPRFGIPNLMRYVVIGQVLVYLAYMFTHYQYSLLSFLTFNLHDVLHGELWRLVTFIFMPNSFRPLSFVILLSFYYFVGNTLEREWGTCRFTVYYLSGMLLSVLGTALASLLSGSTYLTLSSAYYLNLTLFMAFAMLYPDAQILFYMIIPIRAKWLALADAVLFLLGILRAVFALDLIGIILPVVAILNFLLFFWDDILSAFGILKRRGQHQTSHQTIQFKKAAKQQQRREAQQGYRHKCSVCGRTDTEYPDLQFRYCSRCAGYHCFCEEHIFDHVHFTE